MARKSSTQITKDHALMIADRLKATIRKKRKKAHDLAVIYVDGRRVASFGIRRSSRGTIGHDHVPRQLYLTPGDCRELAECTMTYQQWVQALRERGILPNPG